MTNESNSTKKACSYVHTVVEGDTLYGLARRYGVDYGRLMTLNGITNPYNLKVGTEICISADELLRINPQKQPSDFSNIGSRISISCGNN